jgi:RNA polymerase sigma-70 factor, ECF subfamily
MRGDVERAIQILQENEPGAFDRALAALQDTVYSFSMKACGHKQDAEDTMQDVLLKAMSYLQGFDNPRALAVWLYKVARSRCILHRRRTRTASLRELSLDALMPDESEMVALCSRRQVDPETHAYNRQQSAWLQRAIVRLPPPYREALVLHDMEGFHYSEVAEITGVREATIRVRLHRARLFVRKELSAHRRPASCGREPRNTAQPVPPQRCRSLFARLSDYLDGDLDDAFCEEMQKHLANCPPCVVFLASLEQTVELCRKFRPAGRVPLSAKLRQELLSKYEQARGALAAIR